MSLAKSLNAFLSNRSALYLSGLDLSPEICCGIYSAGPHSILMSDVCNECLDRRDRRPEQPVRLDVLAQAAQGAHSADAVSTPGSDMFTTLSHCITHFLRCPRVILLEAFRQLAQQHARHSAGCSATQNSENKPRPLPLSKKKCLTLYHFATNVFILGWRLR